MDRKIVTLRAGRLTKQARWAAEDAYRQRGYEVVWTEEATR